MLRRIREFEIPLRARNRALYLANERLSDELRYRLTQVVSAVLSARY
jgi:hypothetical protein